MYCTRCGTWTPGGGAACARCGEALAPQAPLIEGVEIVAERSPEAPPAAIVPAVRYAGFWRRFASMFVDGLLLFFPDTITRVTLGLPTMFSMRVLREDETGRLMAALALSTVAWWLYCALLESSRWRGTLGQQLLGMQVGDTAGRRISFARGSARYFAQWLSAMLCGIGYLFNLWTARRQTLHDMVAGCVLTVPARDAAPAGVIVTEPRP